jgi:hypothetical protein
MSARNASATTPGPAKAKGAPNMPGHLRQFSETSYDRPFEHPYSHSPGDTTSSNSTIRERPSSRRRGERRWTVTVNESFARDEVLLNFDLIGDEIKPGSLVAIDVLKSDAEKPLANTHHKQHPHDRKDASSAGADRRYICVAKGMQKDLKMRYPMVEVYVAKHIADAFGMKKGTQVTLTPVLL